MVAMQYVTDLHLHSKYSRAVSKYMTLPVMAQVAKQKGLDILTASDFTHPLWFKELTLLLEEEYEGIYILKTDKQAPRKTHFVLSTEISCIYKQGDKVRRIHNLIFAPNLETVEKINRSMTKRGVNISSDGRPIMGLSAKNVLELLMEIDERCFLIPCHIWTPHFGVYGSASGFDSLDEAFEELSPYIFGIETGLSSDPDMNWSVPELATRTILSFSDAHSAPKMGREATVVALQEMTYANLRNAFNKKEQTPNNTILYTIEFYPEEGKYHFSGHRNCKVSYGPEEIRLKGNICPQCKRKMTEGVLYRVQQLADPEFTGRVEEKKNNFGLKWFTDTKKEQPPYVKLVPLLEIVAESMRATVASQKVQMQFARLCLTLGNEIDILLNIPIEEIEKIGGERLAEGIAKIRAGTISIVPGYDGEYGKVSIWQNDDESSQPKKTPQLSLDL